MNLRTATLFGSLTVLLGACAGGVSILDGGSGGTGSGGGSAGGALGNGGSQTAAGGRGNAGGSSAGGTSSGGAASGGSSSGGGPSGGAGGGDTTGGAGGGSGGDGAPSGGADGAGGGGVGPGPSSLPPAPVEPNVPKPSGSPGDVTVLDWAGYKAAVTYSFDDNNQSQITNYDKLNDLGVPFTFYLWTGQSSASNAIWKQARDDGHELANHTKSHSSNCNVQDINDATTFLQNNLEVTPWTMAAPNGAQCYQDAVQGIFFINRGVSPSTPVLPNGNSNPFNLNCYIPSTGQQASAFNNNINDARSKGGWVIYVIHGYTGDGSAYQPVDVNQMVAAIQYAKDQNDVWIGTMVDVGAYWLGQKSFSSAMKTTAGTSSTYTWTLPNKFPTGKYLRVKVPGGTLTQGGAPLTWDPHGYYEIELDKKTLTVAP